MGSQSDGSFTASYGFSGAEGINGNPPVTNASLLTLMNAGSVWNDADSDTLGAWDFGDSTMAPRLFFNDYDGSDGTYGCAGIATNMETFILSNCGNLIGSQ